MKLNVRIIAWSVANRTVFYRSKKTTMQSEKAEPSESKAADGPTSSGTEMKAPSTEEMEAQKPQGISAVAVLWTFGKCLGALLPVYLAGYYRVSTSLLVFGMMVYTGWKHAREAKEARLRSAIQFLNNEEEYTSQRVSKIRRELPAWVRNYPTTVSFCPTKTHKF